MAQSQILTGEQVKGRAGYFIVKPVLMDGTYKLKEGDTVYLRCPLDRVCIHKINNLL